MANIRHKIENGFEVFAEFIFDHRIKSIIGMALIIGLLISQIPGITIDTSTEGFFHEKDPELLTYNQFRDQFGRDEGIIIALKPKRIFDLEFLDKLRQIHAEIEAAVPYIDDLTSLINARNTRGEGDQLIVEDLMENWPQTPADLHIIEQRAKSNPMYKNLLLSEAGDVTTIIIRTQSYSSIGQQEDVMAGFDDDFAEMPDDISSETNEAPIYLTEEENSQVVEAVQKIVRKYRSENLQVQLAGSPVVTHFLKRSLIKDIRKFMVLALLGVAVLLYLMFRRLSGVIIPLLIVILSLLSTLGIMSFTGKAIKLPTQILPSFILAVGVGTSVHILAIFFQQLRKGHNKKEAIKYALGHSGLAVVMTNVTTAAGLMSFATADLAPVADLGIFAGIGVLLAFIYTIVLLPALIAITPLSKKKTQQLSNDSKFMDRFLEAVGRFSTTHPKKILLVSAIVITASLIAMTQLHFSHHPLHWFPESNEIRIDSEGIDKDLRGSITMEVVFDTKMENGLYDPNLLKA
ncbi:MAG: efflux RND transporter permease subunit, partial [Desulfobacteraceae bacterium]